MSLVKQLWLAIFVVILLCLLGSFALMTSSAVNYLQTQLYQKNIDSANNLALTLSSNEFSPVFADVQISSQFDTGFFQTIELSAPNGGTIIKKYSENENSVAPNWFVNVIPLDPPAGTANVNNGWMQVGVLSVQSSSEFAYQELWRNTVQLSIYFLLTAIFSGVVGFILIRHLIKPLDAVIKQSEAIANRRFVTVTEPSTLEFKALVKSMNTLSKRVKSMLLYDAERLQEGHSDSTKDPLTKLLTRDATLASINAYLKRDDETSSGCIILFRIVDLLNLNKIHGREVLDKLLVELAQELDHFSTRWSRAILGRLDGGDVIALIPGVSDTEAFEKELIGSLHNIITSHSLTSDILNICSTNFVAHENIDNILNRIEQASTGATSDSDFIRHVATQDNVVTTDVEDWKNIFDEAFLNKKFQLNLFPVIGQQDQLLHLEAPIRLQFGDNQLLRAGQFLSWAKKLDLMTEIDICSLTLAFDWLAKQKSEIGINISPQLLAHQGSMNRFLGLLKKQNQLGSRLWLEIPENGVYHYLEEFKYFVNQAKPCGCHIGIEHAGHQFEKIGLLHELGLDYIKIDSTFIHNIDDNNHNKIYLQGLVSLTHSIGLKIIAEGVASAEERIAIEKLGFDGITGPAIGLEK